MKLTLAQALQNGVAAHREGKLSEAERLYLEILQKMPGHPDANHNLGVLLLATGKISAALPLFERALEANSSVKQFWLSYIDALMAGNLFEEAAKTLVKAEKMGVVDERLNNYKRQICLKTDAATQILGPIDLATAIELRELGKYSEAQDWLKQALRTHPTDAEALSLLSQVYLLDGRAAESETALANASSINPKLPSIHRNNARLSLHQSKPAEALKNAELGYQSAPEDPESWLVLSACLATSQRIDDALVLAEKTIQRSPNYAEAYGTRALIRDHLSDIDGAIKDAERALKLKPHIRNLWSLLGNLHFKNNDVKSAVKATSRAVENHPEDINQRIFLGQLLRQLGRYTEAATTLKQATKIDPNSVASWINLAAALQEGQIFNEARNAYKRALEIEPDSPVVLNNLGELERASGNTTIAREYFETVIQRSPDFVSAHNNLGNVLRDLGLLNEAEKSYREALRLKRGNAEAHVNLGNLLKDLGKFHDAEDNYRVAIQLKPSFDAAHRNLGMLLKACGKHTDSIKSFETAIACNPSFAEAHNDLGNALSQLGQPEKAIASYRAAIRFDPDYEGAHSNLLLTLNYAQGMKPPTMLMEAERYGAMVSSKAEDKFTSWATESKTAPLRIGFVSGDMKNHPVGFMVEGLLRHINKNQIEVVAFPTKTETDDLTDRIKPLFCSWVPLDGESNYELAKTIYRQNIQILFDLSGHTAHNALPIFAHKPAPIQVSWFGYFATTGLPEMDYLLGDPVVTPVEEADHLLEKQWQLPETYFCSQPPNIDMPVGSLPALENEFVTFGCFNNLVKVNASVIELWASILQRIPRAKLYLKTFQLTDRQLKNRIRQEFSAYGISPTRLILDGPSDREGLLACYRRVDIALDPFPCPGGMTSLEALWMGVPVLTLKGDCFVSHVGETIAHSIGHREWIATSAEDYLAKAVAFSNNLPFLSRLRAGLRSKALRSSLFDCESFANRFEAALTEMWDAHKKQ